MPTPTPEPDYSDEETALAAAVSPWLEDHDDHRCAADVRAELRARGYDVVKLA